MSRFVDRSASDEIALANGEHVRVRQSLTATEQAALRARLFGYEIDMAAGTVKMTDRQIHMQRIELVRAYVLGWNFADDAGQPVPYSPSRVDDLDEATIGEIADGIDRLQAARKEGAAKNGSRP